MVSLDFMESGDISSTDIRELKSLDLDEDVLRYIEDNNLYFIEKILLTRKIVIFTSVKKGRKAIFSYVEKDNGKLFSLS